MGQFSMEISGHTGSVLSGNQQMATELTLKAYLTDHGIPDSQLQGNKFGHNLRKCLRKCIELGLELSQKQAIAVLAVNPSHQKHFSRYGPKSQDGMLALGAYQLFDTSSVLEQIANLIDRVSGDPTVLRRGKSPDFLRGTPSALPPLFPVSLQKLRELEAEADRRANEIARINAEFKRKGLVSKNGLTP
ncbi:hypothetical protein GGR30_002283 [Martelella radicis]|uniref:Uncharacterized protein n=2 Tax=Martelella radicis TaxID=1397476 RepID=A0A7W6KJA1_9HYPH|nr:hypothetical protein [Martelella radicis]